jgi:hypothetical protein
MSSLLSLCGLIFWFSFLCLFKMYSYKITRFLKIYKFSFLGGAVSSSSAGH